MQRVLVDQCKIVQCAMSRLPLISFLLLGRKYSLDQIVQLDLTPEGNFNATSGVVILRSPTLNGIERLLFSQLLGALSPRAAVFVPAAQRQEEAVEAAVTESPGVSQMPTDTDDESAAKQEAEVAAASVKENSAARIIQSRLIRPTLARLAARKAFNESPFIVMWRDWQANAAKRAIILGPVVEMTFALGSVKRLLSKADQKLKVSLKKAVADGSGKLIEIGVAIQYTRLVRGLL